MRTSALFILQTVVVIGCLAWATTAGNACCKGTCHEIPKGCYCPFKAVLCGELNTLTMGKRNSENPYERVASSQLQYQPRRTLTPQADERLHEDRIVGALNNLLTLLKDTHQADQDAFDVQDENDNTDWEAVTSSRIKQPSEHAHQVYRRQSRFSNDVY